MKDGQRHVTHVQLNANCHRLCCCCCSVFVLTHDEVAPSHLVFNHNCTLTLMLTGAANPLLSPTARLCWMQVRPDDLCVFTNVLLCIFGVSSTPVLHLTFFLNLFLILVVHHSVALMLNCFFFSAHVQSQSFLQPDVC